MIAILCDVCFCKKNVIYVQPNRPLFTFWMLEKRPVGVYSGSYMIFELVDLILVPSGLSILILRIPAIFI